MIINIIGGLGRMGRMHKPIFESAGHEVVISDINSGVNMRDAVIGSDLSIVSVPISQTEKVINQLGKYAKAICDFTSVKIRPLEAMLRNCKGEVFGLHPLYGSKDNINGETVVYSPTERSGEIAKELLASFTGAGANVIEMKPEEHDYMMAKLQVARAFVISSFGNLLSQGDYSMERIYQMSPPPTRVMLDLLARQVDYKNDALYEEIAKYNPYSKKVMKEFLRAMKETVNANDPSKMRQFFGEMLESRQKSAKNMIDNLK